MRNEVRKEITTRINFASNKALFYFTKMKNCEKGGGFVPNSFWANKFAQSIRIENHYKKEFSKWLNDK